MRTSRLCGQLLLGVFDDDCLAQLLLGVFVDGYSLMIIGLWFEDAPHGPFHHIIDPTCRHTRQSQMAGAHA